MRQHSQSISGLLSLTARRNTLLLNDLPQTDQRLAYLLGLSVQWHQGRDRSGRAGKLLILSICGVLLLFLWTLVARH